MNITSLFAFATALFSGAVAFSVVWKERRSIVHFAFVAGMALLALESIFSGLSWAAPSVQEMAGWQHWKLLTSSLLPGVWLFFALSYGRGNFKEFLSRAKFLLFAAFLIPLALVLADDQELIVSAAPSSPGLWSFGLGATGFYFFLFLLAGIVLIGINLEKTYRAAVGVMRWRIKFMILGLGILFAVRFCTSSQILKQYVKSFKR